MSGGSSAMRPVASPWLPRSATWKAGSTSPSRTTLVAQPRSLARTSRVGPSRTCYSVATRDELRAATHRAPHFGQTYVVKLPTVCSTTPSVPHFGHLFVGRVGAGTWMGMAVHSTRPRARALAARPGRSSTAASRSSPTAENGKAGALGGPRHAPRAARPWRCGTGRVYMARMRTTRVRCPVCDFAVRVRFGYRKAARADAAIRPYGPLGALRFLGEARAGSGVVRDHAAN